MSFDPRGTNRSNPVRCETTVLADQPNVIPDSGATLAEVTACTRAAFAQYLVDGETPGTHCPIE